MRYIDADSDEVDAFAITKIYRSGLGLDGTKGLALVLDNGEIVIAAAEMTSRVTPAVGDYWVIQPDGTTLPVQKAAFERKYAKVS